jgi:hypothetical protein
LSTLVTMSKATAKTTSSITATAAAASAAIAATDADAFGAVLPAFQMGSAEQLDLTALCLPQNFGTVSGVKKVLTTVPVRKPSNQAFVRVHPSDEWRQSALILQLKEDGDCYFVHPSLYGELAAEVRPKMLYTYVTRDGNVALWPVNLPGEDGRLDTWSQSAHEGARRAETAWVRLVANRANGAYDIYEASSLTEEPAWPEKSFKEILSLAFKDRLIVSLDHPIVKRLRGEI